MLDIIMATHNHIEFTIPAIEALKRNTPVNFKLTCIDDSTDRFTPTYLYSLNGSFNVNVIHHERTEGNQNVNKGLENTESNPVVFMAQNTIVEPHWVEYPLEIFKNNHVALIGIKLLYQNGLIEHAGIVLPEGAPAHSDIGRFEPGHRLTYICDVPAVGFALVFINREAFPNGFPVGLYPNGFCDFDDVDICFDAKKRGWQIIYCGLSSAYHYANATRDVSGDYWERREQNRKFFISRWGTGGTER